MKKFKQIAFGLMVGALAIGFSAFTNAHSLRLTNHHRTVKAGMITDDFLVQSSSATFTQNASPDPSNCKSTSTRQCIYDVTTSGQSNIPDQASYAGSDVDTYVSNGWLTADPSSKAALYHP
jgi:hypothetical protein